MTWLIIVLIVTLLTGIYVIRREKTSYDQATVAGDIIYICRKCFEERYSNTWLGLRVQECNCQVCHKTKICDRVPVSYLERRV